MSRFDRQLQLFGGEGQAKLEATTVAIVGIGGLGTHLAQQLALLGVRSFWLIDHEELADSNRNRYIGARFDDSVPGTPKVLIGERTIKAIDPMADVHKVPHMLQSVEAYEAIRMADVVFGCLDREGPRFILNHVCLAYNRRFIDAATEIVPGSPTIYGGRVFVCWEAPGCLVCANELDMDEVNEDLASPEALQNREAVYGVKADDLRGSGPSVVSLNGVVASIAVTEFMVGVTGLRPPKQLSTYRAHMGTVAVGTPLLKPDCYSCSLRGQGDAADIAQYLQS